MHRLSLQTRLLIPLVFGILLSLTVVHFVLIPQQQEKARQHLQQHTMEVIIAAQGSLIKNILESDLSTLHANLNYLTDLYKDKWFNLRVYNYENIRLYPLHTVTDAYPKGIDIFPIDFPLELQGSKVGKILLAVDLEEAQLEQTEKLRQMEWLLIVIFVLIIIINLITQHHFIIKPLRLLRAAAEQMTRGHFDIALPTLDAPEVSQLNDAFTQMRNTVKHSQQNQQIAREEAERALVIKNEFLANMSHEIRTPLNAIIGMNQLALQTDLNKVQRNFIQKSSEAADSLRVIINDILDFSKIEANRIELEHNNFMLEDVLENLAGLFALSTEEKSLDLLFHVRPNVPTALIGDQLRLSQILINLTGNAIKFTPEGGLVTIAVQLLEADDQNVLLEFCVQDTGIGISEEQKQKLFSPFTQADNSTTRKYGGTGLGLAISKRLTEIMQGTISLQSEPDKGSSFIFTVKMGKQEHQPMYHMVAHHLGPLRVLVVEKLINWHWVLKDMLTSLGFKPETCQDSEQAKEILTEADSKVPFDIILLDNNVDEENGESLLEFLRGHHLLKTPGVIKLTGHMTDPDAEALAEPVRGLLSKPITLNTLLDTILFSLSGFKSNERSVNHQQIATSALKSLEGARILLVEDNEINQELATELLRQHNISVQLAENGKRALELLSQHEFDGILMDCQMPVMDGYEATRQIRKQSRYADLPIIAMTANVMVSDRKKALDAGMNDHIDKPINVDMMFQTMAKWIKPTKRPLKFDQLPKKPDFRKKPQTPQPPKTTDAVLPDSLPGIDLKRAMRTTQNNTSLFLRLADKFYTSQREFEHNFITALGRDQQEAERLAHTLKGTAGNLGMIEVQTAALLLEKSVRDNSDTSGPLKKVVAELGIVLRSLNKVLPQSKQQTTITPAQSTPLASKELMQTLHQLRELINQDNIEVDGLIKKVIPMLSGPHAEAMQQIQKSTQGYDFEKALSLTDDLINSLG